MNRLGKVLMLLVFFLPVLLVCCQKPFVKVAFSLVL